MGFGLSWEIRMLRIAWITLVASALIGAWAGCARVRHYQVVDQSAATSAIAGVVPTTSTPAAIQADWASLPDYPLVDELLGADPPATEYYVLSAEECQCQAAAKSVRGNVLAAESQLVCSTRRDRHGRITPEGALLANLLAIRAVDERNQVSGDAMELFYRLAEAELQRNVIRRSLEKIDQAVHEYQELRDRGLALAIDEGALHRQRFEILKRQVQLETSADQAQGQLRRILGLDGEQPAALSPAADLSVSVAPVAVEEAVARGLAMRPDMAMLRALGGNVNQETLPAVRAGLQQTDALLGALSPPSRALGRILGDRSSGCEWQTRQSQLELVLRDQRIAAEEEIRQAAREVESKLRQAALAKQTWESWTGRVRELQEKRGITDVTPFEIRTAELEALQAEGEAVRALVDYKVAEARLEEAQGLLAQECGYPLPPSCASAQGRLHASAAAQ